MPPTHDSGPAVAHSLLQDIQGCTIRNDVSAAQRKYGRDGILDEAPECARTSRASAANAYAPDQRGPHSAIGQTDEWLSALNNYEVRNSSGKQWNRITDP